MLTITIDKRVINTEPGKMVLDVALEHGIDIPSLCNHDGIEPFGSCRLCLVEVTHPNWKGRRRIVTSCLYPVENGLIVNTGTDEIIRIRKVILDLLLSHSPNSKKIQEMARHYGINKPSFPIDEQEPDPCIMCGLCVRVCQETSTAAISTTGRGVIKEISTPLSELAEDCIGCGACAMVCPIENIQFTHENGEICIWNKRLPVPVAYVDKELCQGCGICEEICPFNIPRVVIDINGMSTAVISPDYCRGCGLCVANCPYGAIDQKDFSHESIEKCINKASRNSIVFACHRSPFREERSELVAMPCTGRVSVPNLLECLAMGFDQILVLGRNEDICSYKGGESIARDNIRKANKLGQLMGLGGERIEWAQTTGQDGPQDAVIAFKTRAIKANPNPIKTRFTGEMLHKSGDKAIYELLSWLRQREELTQDRDSWLIDNELNGEEEKNVIYTGCLPAIDMVLKGTIDEWNGGDLVKDALALLSRTGIKVSTFLSAGACKYGGEGGFSKDRGTLLHKEMVIALCPECAKGISQELGSKALTIDTILMQNINRLHMEKIESSVALTKDHENCLPLLRSVPGLNVLYVDEKIPWENKRELERLLQKLDNMGAAYIILESPGELAFIKRLRRRGSWRKTKMLPIMLYKLMADMLK